MFDLVLKGGRVIDPAQGVDARLDVAFADGKVAELGPDLPGGKQTRDVSGSMVVPFGPMERPSSSTAESTIFIWMLMPRNLYR